jgi:uncharacterized protein (DUF4415 family)
MRRNGTTVRYTAEEARKLAEERKPRIDYARIDAMTEEELEASIDHEEEGRFEDWIPVKDARAIAFPEQDRQLDADVVAWFAAKEPDYLRRINDVLRDYIKAQETMSSAAD